MLPFLIGALSFRELLATEKTVFCNVVIFNHLNMCILMYCMSNLFRDIFLIQCLKVLVDLKYVIFNITYMKKIIYVIGICKYCSTDCIK